MSQPITIPGHATFNGRMLGHLDAAAYLGIGESTLRKWRSEGRIQAVRIGPKLLRYRISDLDALASK